jgi:hypothetical protein
MQISVDAMARIASNAMDLALAFDHGVLAGRDRHARLLEPFAWVGGLRRDADHVALLRDRLRNVGDGLVVQTEKERKFLFCCHGCPQLA